MELPESDIRLMARDNHNSYHILASACCREVYDPIKHSGCFASVQEAEKFIKDNQDPAKQKELKIAELDKLLEHLQEDAKETIERFQGRGGDIEITFYTGENFIIFFGSKPGIGIAAKTDMMKAIVNTFDSSMDKRTFTVTIPACFDSVATKDASIEVIVSNSFQSIKL